MRICSLIELQMLPFFKEFQESRDVCFDGFNQFAKCYKSINTEPIETLFFEVDVSFISLLKSTSELKIDFNHNIFRSGYG